MRSYFIVFVTLIYLGPSIVNAKPKAIEYILQPNEKKEITIGDKIIMFINDKRVIYDGSSHKVYGTSYQLGDSQPIKIIVLGDQIKSMSILVGKKWKPITRASLLKIGYAIPSDSFTTFIKNSSTTHIYPRFQGKYGSEEPPHATRTILLHNEFKGESPI